jgi:hypothetical protein
MLILQKDKMATWLTSALQCLAEAQEQQLPPSDERITSKLALLTVVCSGSIRRRIAAVIGIMKRGTAG